MHILLPETNNCPSWISGRESMMVENTSWPIFMKKCCQPNRGRTRSLLITSQMRIQLKHRGHPKILWLSSLPESLMKSWSKMNLLSSDNIFIRLWGPQGWVTLMPIAETGPKSNLPKILCLPSLSAKFDEDSIKNEVYCLDNIFTIICLWETKGLVTFE